MEKLLLLIVLLKLFFLKVLADTQLRTPPHCGKSNLLSSTARVFDGNITGRDEYPWLVYLKTDILFHLDKDSGTTILYESNCTSSLISSNWVLTAAHCVFLPYVDRSPLFIKRNNSVALGVWNVHNDADCDENNKCAPKIVKLAAIDVIIHPKFYTTQLDMNYDIALLRLERDIEFSPYIQPICLPLEPVEEKSPSYEGRQVIVTGWGKYDNKSDDGFKRKATVAVSDHEACREWLFGYRLPFNEKYQLCVGGPDGSTCKGDSGGPLLLQSSNDENTFYQIGVTSMGRQECVNNSEPSVHVRVDAFIDWISETIQQNDSNNDDDELE